MEVELKRTVLEAQRCIHPLPGPDPAVRVYCLVKLDRRCSEWPSGIQSRTFYYHGM